MIEKFKYWLYRKQWDTAPYIHWSWPVHVDFELTSFCNLKCNFCPHSAKEQQFEKQHMNIGLFRACIDEIEGHVPSIKINLRGESTIYPDLSYALEYVRDKFIDIRINTNGQYKKDAMTLLLINNCTEVIFSVDAIFDKTYRSIRGADLETLETNIHYAIDTVKALGLKTKIVLSFTITKENEKELKLFMSTWQKIDPGILFNVRPVWDRLTHQNTFKGRKNCNFPDRRLVVASNGDVYPCCVQWTKPFLTIGNVYKESLYGIWNNESMRQLRKQLHKKPLLHDDLHECCQRCDSREGYIV